MSPSARRSSFAESARCAATASIPACTPRKKGLTQRTQRMRKGRREGGCAPPSRFARLLIAEKRLACDCTAPEDLAEHLPVFIDLDGSRHQGLWAIVDHLEGTYPVRPLTPDDDTARSDSLRLLDWAMGPFLENVTKRIVYERASQRYTGSVAQRAPDMQI